ncbi:hypothetical protein [Algoriella sp.]|uniref:hypothetical protein n=1 Tax=Algoriella sp. TaxID=1872434 RepID=UPI001B1A02C3|nr:hypothetical protein [Algoriella sp.]MBO6213562.1 hypothetical protein [Algoriella sp.]
MKENLKMISFFICYFALYSFTSAQVGIGLTSKTDSLAITSPSKTSVQPIIYVKSGTKITIATNTTLDAKVVYLKEQPKKKQVVLAKEKKILKKNKLSEKLEEFTKVTKVKLLKPKFHLQQGNLPLSFNSSTSVNSSFTVVHHHDYIKKHIVLTKKTSLNYFTTFYLEKNTICFDYKTLKDTGFTTTCGIRPPPTVC